VVAIISLFAKAKNITKKAEKERASRNFVTALLSLLFLLLSRIVGTGVPRRSVKGEPYFRDIRDVCTKSVGTGVLDGPQIELTKYGQIVEKYICQLSDFTTIYPLKVM